MNATRELIANYIRAWNETDPLRRRVLIEDVYAEHAVYTDPLAQARGWEAIDTTIDAVQGMFPGHVFTLAGDVDAHHDVARFHWHLAAPGADEPLVIGFDVAELDEGRIRRVHGFLDKVPMAA
ncbi:nuclear transport factor 2 family protein [Frateuria sp. MAH-13]|uniref:Nuclear transport factor 2 family protein n=1 Tax=Frateuria flava TaxID=2821489 RepID=A0ABS4DJW0_9GAMM|nr:nuclear transport factor 2 family protein [Frateuria flava]MBP1473331.1 nuclear transport factor 2 family protein [Frateuria flava]